MSSTKIPVEILEQVGRYSGTYICTLLGLDLSSVAIREVLFQDGGPGVVLDKILSEGGDHRALFTIYKYVPATIAIAKAAETRNIRLLKRVCVLWGTRHSNLGFLVCLNNRFERGAKMVGHTLDFKDRANECYAVTGQLDRLVLTGVAPLSYMDDYITRNLIDQIWERVDKDHLLLLCASMGYLDYIYKAIDMYMWVRAVKGTKRILTHVIRNLPHVDFAITIYNRYMANDSDNHYNIKIILKKTEDKLSALNLIKNPPYLYEAILTKDMDYLYQMGISSIIDIIKDLGVVDILDRLTDEEIVNNINKLPAEILISRRDLILGNYTTREVFIDACVKDKILMSKYGFGGIRPRDILYNNREIQFTMYIAEKYGDDVIEDEDLWAPYWQYPEDLIWVVKLAEKKKYIPIFESSDPDHVINIYDHEIYYSKPDGIVTSEWTDTRIFMTESDIALKYWTYYQT